jgi:type III pantothenate kinase
MLLALDVGNTHTVLGLFGADGRLAHTWRVGTDRSRTGDEWAALYRSLLGLRDLAPAVADVAVIGSVVPPVGEIWQAVCEDALGIATLAVGPDTPTGMTLAVDRPSEVGADRVANAVAARDLWGAPAVVVDFGTAVTFDAVSADGQYVGGAIAPGLTTAAEALVQRTAKLPRIALVAPARAIGTDTVSAMQAGIVFGFAGQVETLVRRVASELGGAPVVLATGGQAGMIANVCPAVGEVVPELTLLGLAVIAGRAGLVGWRVRR